MRHANDGRRTSSLSLVVDTLVADLALRDELEWSSFSTIFITSPEVNPCFSVAEFLAQLPGNTHAILVGRFDPELPLAKWRLSGGSPRGPNGRSPLHP